MCICAMICDFRIDSKAVLNSIRIVFLLKVLLRDANFLRVCKIRHPRSQFNFVDFSDNRMHANILKRHICLNSIINQLVCDIMTLLS